MSKSKWKTWRAEAGAKGGSEGWSWGISWIRCSVHESCAPSLSVGPEREGKTILPGTLHLFDAEFCHPGFLSISVNRIQGIVSYLHWARTPVCHAPRASAWCGGSSASPPTMPCTGLSGRGCSCPGWYAANGEVMKTRSLMFLFSAVYESSAYFLFTQNKKLKLIVHGCRVWKTFLFCVKSRTVRRIRWVPTSHLGPTISNHDIWSKVKWTDPFGLFWMDSSERRVKVNFSAAVWNSTWTSHILTGTVPGPLFAAQLYWQQSCIKFIHKDFLIYESLIKVRAPL